MLSTPAPRPQLVRAHDHLEQRDSASISNDWSLLEAQTVGGTNIDLIVKGVVDGRRQVFFS